MQVSNFSRLSVTAFACIFTRVIGKLTRTSIETYNKEKFLNLILNRNDRGLITVSNHTATVDDAVVFSVLPLSVLLSTPSIFRWSLGAKEICFTNSLYNWFFSSGQILPIERGAGIFQDTMDRSIEKLNKKEWIHIFSEGRVNQSSEMLRFKWGISRLIMESKIPPLIIPFYHTGIDKLLPLKSYIPRMNNEVKIAFGNPIDSKILLKKVEGLNEKEARIFIANYLREKTIELQVNFKKYNFNKV
ncbi:hypothetical protein HK099_004663 [Clydaea vesicula]|uniref:Tafazzin family protein n=1 Tax=Clydaea vesicula TaxID=447962 RepID=A0AAD5XVH1_9FUNG|nr:hypothetical protein HK099_004663 [Clydaea vesicula]KAJ3397287.1 hypothetical protein HDU92_008828 [Lobulomyces angularis]